MGGGQEPHVCFHRRATPQSLELAILQDTEDLDLGNENMRKQRSFLILSRLHPITYLGLLSKCAFPLVQYFLLQLQKTV